MAYSKIDTFIIEKIVTRSHLRLLSKGHLCRTDSLPEEKLYSNLSKGIS